MARRTPIVGGNWKMNTRLDSARELAEDVVAACAGLDRDCDVVVYPPFPYLQAVGHVLASSCVHLGAQDLFHEAEGAFTGEVSAGMLLDLGVHTVLVGHSERRHVIGEDDATVNRKLHAALDAGLHATLCVGETLEQRERGETDAVNLAQLEAGLDGVSRDAMARVVVAYEPVWAIGTGRTATPDDAQSVHARLRAAVAAHFDDDTAAALRIQYGGSVKASNADDLFARPDVDGGLVGGASLDADEFTTIVRAAVTTAGTETARL